MPSYKHRNNKLSNNKKPQGERTKHNKHKAITSKTRYDTGQEEVARILSMSDRSDLKPIIGAPCFNCPYENICGPDPDKFSHSPENCELLTEWVTWSLDDIEPKVNFLRRTGGLPAPSSTILQKVEAS